MAEGVASDIRSLKDWTFCCGHRPRCTRRGQPNTPLMNPADAVALAFPHAGALTSFASVVYSHLPPIEAEKNQIFPKNRFVMSEDINVDHIARLARLELSDHEKIAFRKEIPEILDYVRQLQEVDVEGVEPTAHAADIVNVMRADEIGPSQDLDATMKNAPAVAEGELFKVAKVLDDGGSA